MRFSVDVDHTAVEPGGTFTGTVQLHAPGARTLLASLRWMTRGKGDTDEGIAATVTIPIAGRDRVPFSITAPYQPFSCSGKLISIGYRLVIEVDGAEDVTEVTIGPGGEEVSFAGAE